MVNPIPNFAKNVWSKWNIRVVILTSFSLQIILNFFAISRKRSRSNILVMLLWSTYLLADCAAIFCIGLISSKYGDEDMPISNVNDFLIAFWAPFLLLHLGGPDTITAFALEDNELWLRHMLGLIVQVCLTGYVFLLTLPVNTLWLPTALVYLAGIIKFAERTRALQLASTSNFRQSKFRKPDRGPNYAKLMEELKTRIDAGIPAEVVTIMSEISDEEEEGPHLSKAPYSMSNDVVDHEQDGIAYQEEKGNNNEQDGIAFQEKSNNEQEVLSDVKVVKEAYRYFNIFKGIVVDMIFSLNERNVSHNFYRKLTAVDALRVIEVELNFFYDAFYTKASVIGDKVGLCFRFLSIGSVVAASVLFVHDQKHGCDHFDVKVTYTLLYGAVALDVVSLFMLILSDHSFALFYPLGCQKINDSDNDLRTYKLASILSRFLKLKRPKWREHELKKPTWFQNRRHKILCRPVLFRRWSESISGFNLISYCLQKRTLWVDYVIDSVGAKELVEQWKYEEKQPLLQELWIFIFRELERKSADADDFETIQRICSCRGEWVLEESVLLLHDLDKLMPYVERNSVTFDQCVILWHIATDLLFYEDGDDGQRKNENAPDDGQKKNENDDLDLEQGNIDDGQRKNEIAPDEVKKGSDDGQRKNENAPDDVKKGSEDGQKKNEIAQDNVKKGSDDGQRKNENARDDDGTLKSDFEDVDELKDFSKLLSDYMLYLLIMQPTMMFAVRGIVEIRFQDTCAEAIHFFRHGETKTKEAFYESIKKFIFMDVGVELEPSAVKGGSSESLLFHACRLAHQLNKAGRNKWKIIAQVWVELLSYAAANCTPITHVQQLSKGGEFVSLVWLLMTHLGIAKQFQVKKAPRTKVVFG